MSDEILNDDQLDAVSGGVLPPPDDAYGATTTPIATAPTAPTSTLSTKPKDPYVKPTTTAPATSTATTIPKPY